MTTAKKRSVSGPGLKSSILNWITATADVLKHSAWTPALDFEGVDIVETLRGPIFTALLDAQAGGDDRSSDTTRSTVHSTMQTVGKARRTIFQRLLVSSKDPAYSRPGFFLLEQQLRLTAGTPRPTSVLFWPTQPTHPPVQIPVARALEDIGVRTDFVTNRPKIFSQLRAHGVRPIGTRCSWASVVELARKRAAAAARLLELAPGVSLPDLGDFDAKSGDPALQEVSGRGAEACIGPASLVEVLRKTIRAHLERVHEAIATTDAARCEMNPGALVVGNDLTPEGRATCLRLTRESVRTGCFLHGAIAGWPLHGFHVADRVFAYGRKSQEQLIMFGTAPKRVVVSGAPLLDKLPTQSGTTVAAIRSRLRLLPGQPWILVATSGAGATVSLDHHLHAIECVMRLSLQMPHVRFVAKLHRKDDPELYAAVARRVPGHRLRVVPNGTRGLPQDINAWLQGCKLLITGASSVAVEAMLLDVPVVTMDLCGELRDVDFTDAGATLHVESPDELRGAVLSVLEGSPRLETVHRRVRSFLGDTFIALDGQSARRAASELRSLVVS